MPDFEIRPVEVVDGEDEDLDTGPRRQLPRWVPSTVVATVLALVVGVLVARHHDPSPQAAPGPSATPSGTRVVLDPNTGARLAAKVAVAVADSRDGRVYSLTRDGTILVRNLDGSDPTTAFASLIDGVREPLLAVDAAHHLLWLVTAGSSDAGSTLESLDTARYSAATQIPVPGTVVAITILDGRVYLAAGRTILQLAADGMSLRTVARLSLGGGAGSLVADPTRHRLLLLDVIRRQVISWSPASGFGATSGAPVTTGRLAVTGGVIWAVGSDGDGGDASIVPLDPSTLVAYRAISLPDIPTGATLETTGDHSLFVGAGSALWCYDGSSGALRMHWASLPRPFVVARGQGYTVGYGELRPVSMGSCRG